MPPGTFTSSLLASPSFTRSARLLENSGEKATTKFVSLTPFPMFCGRGGEFRAEGVVTLHPPHRVGKDELLSDGEARNLLHPAVPQYHGW